MIFYCHVFSLFCLLYMYNPTPDIYIYTYSYSLCISTYVSWYISFVFGQRFCFAKYDVLARTALGIATLAVQEDFGTQEVSSSFGGIWGHGVANQMNWISGSNR